MRLWLGCGLVWLFAQSVSALPVPLRAVDSSATAKPGYPLTAAVDGVLAPDNGWSLNDPHIVREYAVFATTTPLTASTCQLQFSFLSHEPGASFCAMEIDVTTDEKPTVNGRWMPLVPESTFSDCPDGVKLYGDVVIISGGCSLTQLTVRAPMPFSGITGFRLYLRPPNGTPPETAGAAGNSPGGNFILTELQLEARPAHSSNIALGRQVYTMGRRASSLPPRNLTDGFDSTYSRPDKNRIGSPFFFELDFGGKVDFDHIAIHGRDDAEMLNRLGAYRLELLSESGEVQPMPKWTGLFHTNGTHLARGEVDLIRAGDGVGTFSGRLIRIYRAFPDELQPQIAEVEVYPSLKPQALYWTADARSLPEGKLIMVPADIKQLQFTIKCGEPDIPANVVMFRWRLSNSSKAWQEVDPTGRVKIEPAPEPGNYELSIQARHTDGIWDESIQTINLQIALPWWQTPRYQGMLLGGIILLGAGSWWRVVVWRMKRRLAVAERTMQLNRERLRIARDMHDDVGARLTHIALLADRHVSTRTNVSSEEEADLRQLAENARSAVSAMDAIVWTVNPQNDTVGNFADFICDYAPDFMKLAKIHCEFDMQISSPQTPLGLRRRHELLMAAKEALQNVAKHSQATEVRLIFRQTPETVAFSVVDNGIGMPKELPKGLHHGLENMRQRLEEVGGRCEIISNNGHAGTAVHFTILLEAEEMI